MTEMRNWYRLELASGEPHEIYSQAMPGGAIDVTADGARVLSAEFHAESDVIELLTPHRTIPRDALRQRLRWTADLHE